MNTLIGGHPLVVDVHGPRTCRPSHCIDPRPELLGPTDGKNVVPAPYGHLMLDVLFPLACPGCGAAGPGGRPLCPRCATELRPAPPAPPPPGIDAWWAPFSYEGVARE